MTYNVFTIIIQFIEKKEVVKYRNVCRTWNYYIIRFTQFYHENNPIKLLQERLAEKFDTKQLAQQLQETPQAIKDLRPHFKLILGPNLPEIYHQSVSEYDFHLLVNLSY